MKFGTADGTFPSAAPNFTLLGDIWGFPAQKHENLPKNFQSCKLFRTTGAYPSPDFSEIYVLYARNLSTEHIKIWCNLVHNYKFIGTKLRWVISPQIFKAPSSGTTGRTQKVKVGPKMVRTCPIQCQVWWRSAAARQRERKNGCFLFVTLTVCVSLVGIHAFKRLNDNESFKRLRNFPAVTG